jgi:membrane fusion protein (multidrug efflux system)
MDIQVKSKKFLKIVLFITSIGVFSAIFYEAFYWFTHVYEYNARIRTELTTLASRVDGNIAKIHVKEGQTVKEGDLLVSLDAEAQRMRIEALKADRIREKAHRGRLMAEKETLERDLQSRAATKREVIRALKIELRAIRDRLDLSHKNLKRSRILFRKELTSKKSLEIEQDKSLILEGQVKSAAAKIKVAERELGEIKAARSRINVILSEIKISQINVKKINLLIKEKQSELKYLFIKSPIDGFIDKVYKYKGEHIAEGERIVLLHDPNSFWIEADIDEDQIRHLKLGQGVVIDIDAYPFDTFYGTVTQIARVTTAQMALGTAEGENGKTGKSAQRIPIRVKLHDPPKIIAPGMLVEVNIQIYEQIKF